MAFYGNYYTRPPAIVFHDPYPSYFWFWMLDRSLEERALWAYHHRANMDAARYQAMLAKDAQLEARIKALETKGLARDPAYVPAGMDPDLMYSDAYVDAAYNPVPADGTGWFITKLLCWLSLLGATVAIIYFVFWYRAF